MATIKNNMTIEEALTLLKYYNKWRRGAKITQPSPAEIGLAIDRIINHCESANLKFIDKDSQIETLKKNNAKLKDMVSYYADAARNYNAALDFQEDSK